MQLNEKITVIRKLNNLSQEEFAEELNVSRQAVSKWENGNSVPDTQTLIKIADLCNITLDELMRDEYDIPGTKIIEDITEDTKSFDVSRYLGKVCDVSMNSFTYGVLRNVKIVGIFKNLICFEKNNRYGYFNIHKLLGISEKRSEEYTEHSTIDCGNSTVYVNKGTYFGGMTYAFSSIVKVDKESIGVQTGKIYTDVLFDDVSVILMRDKIK